MCVICGVYYLMKRATPATVGAMGGLKQVVIRYGICVEFKGNEKTEDGEIKKREY